ncbi:hypothetical protein HDU93_004644, partial [Gonapodya sp. JEL0774]
AKTNFKIGALTLSSSLSSNPLLTPSRPSLPKPKPYPTFLFFLLTPTATPTMMAMRSTPPPAAIPLIAAVERVEEEEEDEDEESEREGGGKVPSRTGDVEVVETETGEEPKVDVKEDTEVDGSDVREADVSEEEAREREEEAEEAWGDVKVTTGVATERGSVTETPELVEARAERPKVVGYGVEEAP